MFSSHPREIIIIITELLRDTGLNYNNQKITTTHGLPTGDVLSPQYWAIILAPLCRELEELEVKGQATSRFYADDAVAVCHNERALWKVWEKFKSFSKKLKIVINTKKSAV